MNTFDSQKLLAARGVVPLECDIAFFARTVERYERELDQDKRRHFGQLSVLAERIVLCRLTGLKGPARKKEVIDQLQAIRQRQAVRDTWIAYSIAGLADNVQPYKASGLL